MALTIFETDADLAPLDLLRPQCDILVGALSLRERLERRTGETARLLARPELAVVAGASAGPNPSGLFVAANFLPKEPVPVEGPEDVGVVNGPAGERIAWLRLGAERAARFDRTRPAEAAQGLPRRLTAGEFLDHPWDVIRHQAAQLREDCLTASRKRVGRLGANVFLDERDGPVVIEPDVEIEPFVLIVGPSWIGAGSRVKAHSAIRMSLIGEGSRVGGEISCSTLFPFVNKQHDGFLGHSVVGSWVNIGAGATGSNLKNTYGEIRVDGAGTGLQYFGQVIGDHTKVAILSAMNTGSIYGICANIFGGEGGLTSPLPKRVPSFAFGAGVARLEPVLATARTAMSRRQRELTPAMAELIALRHRELAAR